MISILLWGSRLCFDAWARDSNFGSRAADVLLEKWPHEDLIFTAPTEDGTKRYADSDVELRVATPP